jgi:hypothetical protein
MGQAQPRPAADPSWMSVDGMIVAASTTLLAESRSGGRDGFLPWMQLVVGSVASLAANVAVAEPTATGRVIAAWPSFALIASYELLMRQVRRAADASTRPPRPSTARARPTRVAAAGVSGEAGGQRPGADGRARRGHAGRDAQVLAWQWALANRSSAVPCPRSLTGRQTPPDGGQTGRSLSRSIHRRRAGPW